MHRWIIKFLTTAFDCFVVLGIIGLVCFILHGLWLLVLKDIVPIKQTQFDSYGEFRTKAAYNFFPSEPLPSSLEEKYFYYSVKLDKQKAVSFRLGEDKYEELKEEYLERSIQLVESSPIEVRRYVWDGEQVRGVTEEFLQTEKLMFVNNVFSGDIGQYTFLFDSKEEAKNTSYSTGIICNDETRELIFYDYVDVMFLEEEDD